MVKWEFGSILIIPGYIQESFMTQAIWGLLLWEIRETWWGGGSRALCLRVLNVPGIWGRGAMSHQPLDTGYSPRENCLFY